MLDHITSLQNDRVKLARSLQQRPRARRKERKIVLEGVRLIRDAIEQGSIPDFILVDLDQVEQAMLNMLESRKIALYSVTREIINDLADTQNPQGIVAVFHMPMPRLPITPKRVLILDNLRDPGNMGTMLRTAAAAGVEVVILSTGCADPYNPKAIRSGMGAHFRVPVVEASWTEILTYCAPFSVYVAAGDGLTNYDLVDWNQKWVLVIGSEAHGLSQDVERLVAERIRIPMAAKTESLNASMAASVILFEAARQRRAAGK